MLYEWDLDGDGLYNDATGVTAPVSFGDQGLYPVGVRVTDDKDATATASSTVTVNNVAPVVDVDLPSQTLQYSDALRAVTVTASDVAADSLTASAQDMPVDLSFDANDCTEAAGRMTCTWTLSGFVGVPEGTHDIKVTVTDDDGGETETTIVVTVTPEDATVGFAPSNPVSVGVAAPGGASVPFALTLFVKETQPDVPEGASGPGDVGHAEVSVSLAPVGPGGVATPVGPCARTVASEGYDGLLTVVCPFQGVPVNTYAVQVAVDGGYYEGSSEDVLTVFDPSLGFTTGGGWFYWPGTSDRTNFGLNAKFLKNKKVQGSLLLIRHLADGTIYRVKSNALYGLAIGEMEDGGWASLSGKATYLEPGRAWAHVEERPGSRWSRS